MKRITALLSLVLLVLFVFSLTSCEPEDQVVIASKPMTEQLILAEMLTLIEERSDLRQALTGNRGGTSNIHPAMIKGEIGIYPVCGGLAGCKFSKRIHRGPDGTLCESVKAAYDETYSITMA